MGRENGVLAGHSVLLASDSARDRPATVTVGVTDRILPSDTCAYTPMGRARTGASVALWRAGFVRNYASTRICDDSLRCGAPPIAAGGGGERRLEVTDAGTG